jgi:hypothetical protein
MLQANSVNELMQELLRMDINVPSRAEGRTKEHTERYAIAYLLSTLSRTELAYPLCLIGASDQISCY